MSNRRSLRLLLPLVGAAMAATFAISCSKENQRFVPNADDGTLTPTMTTVDVSTLISDSGYTRYHLEAPLWLIFDDTEEPFWRFPQGLHVEQYDLEMQPAANVLADSAIFFSRKRLWRLDGNVVMVNNDADSFLTQQIFWDQAAKKLYTDSFIHIVRADRILEGYGFISNENMSQYSVARPTAILPAERPGTKRKTSTDSLTTKAPKTSNNTKSKQDGEETKQTSAPAATTTPINRSRAINTRLDTAGGRQSLGPARRARHISPDRPNK